MNALTLALQQCLNAMHEPGDPELVALLNEQIMQIENRLIAMGRYRQEMLAAIASVKGG
jgi:hypothetical protein